MYKKKSTNSIQLAFYILEELEECYTKNNTGYTGHALNGYDANDGLFNNVQPNAEACRAYCSFFPGARYFIWLKAPEGKGLEKHQCLCHSDKSRQGGRWMGVTSGNVNCNMSKYHSYVKLIFWHNQHVYNYCI